MENDPRWKMYLSSSHLEASNSVPFKPSQENGHKFAYQNRHLANPIFLMFQRWILSRISQQRPHQFSRTGHIMSMAIFNGSRLSTMAVQWWSECGTNETCGIIRHYYEVMMIKTFVESFKGTMLPTQRGQIWLQKVPNYHDSSESNCLSQFPT